MDEVVHHHDVVETSVANDSKVLDSKPVLGFHAVVAMKQPPNKLLFSIEVIDNGLSVVGSGGSKEVDLVVGAEAFEELAAVWPHVEADLLPRTSQSHI